MPAQLYDYTMVFLYHWFMFIVRAEHKKHVWNCVRRSNLINIVRLCERAVILRNAQTSEAVLIFQFHWENHWYTYPTWLVEKVRVSIGKITDAKTLFPDRYCSNFSVPCIFSAAREPPCKFSGERDPLQIVDIRGSS